MSQLTHAGVKQNTKIQIKIIQDSLFLRSPAISINDFANRDRSIGYDGHGPKIKRQNIVRRYVVRAGAAVSPFADIEACDSHHIDTIDKVENRVFNVN